MRKDRVQFALREGASRTGGKSPTTNDGREELCTSPNIARRVGWCEGVRREEPSDQERPSALAEWRNSRIVRGLE